MLRESCHNFIKPYYGPANSYRGNNKTSSIFFFGGGAVDG
jgi:hypothetical protein